jgi:hypothetical protein
MRFLAPLAAISIYLSSTAEARLGWTIEQCENFYGSNGISLPGTHGMPRWEFDKDGFGITCWLINNTVQVISYGHRFASMRDQRQVSAQPLKYE